MNTPAPQSAAEVRSFLGTIGFSARFLHDLATTTEPLRQLTRTGTTFTWGSEQQKAFNALKAQLTAAPALAFFNKDAELEVIADASPVGLGAMLVQIVGSDHRVVSYASMTLSAAERRYSQTGREALGLVWACERFRQYLFGRHFTFVTDHKPLECIYLPRSRPFARIERWVLPLQSFDYKVRYIAGKDNCADALSRLPIQDTSARGRGFEESVRLIVSAQAPVAIDIRDIEEASATDPELLAVAKAVRSSDWTTTPTPYRSIRHELTSVGHVILRGHRIVLPTALRRQVLDLAHEGHQGIVKTKSRLRAKVWWPAMDREAEARCRTCHACQVVSPPTAAPPVRASPMPDTPWTHLATNILGLLPSGEYLLVTVDYYSRFMEVDVLKTTSSGIACDRLESHFARHGVPKSLRTDNGPQFVSVEFADLLTSYGVSHVRTTPLWLRANGEVERQNATLLEAIRAAQVEGKAWQRELQVFLLAYRITPHSVTGVAPADLLFNWQVRSKLPQVQMPTNATPATQRVQDLDAEQKQARNDSANSPATTHKSNIGIGSRVLLQRSNRRNKTEFTFHHEPFTVTRHHHDQVVLRPQEGRQEIRRNVKFVKPFFEADHLMADAEEGPDPPAANTPSHTPSPTPEVPASPLPRIQPGRQARARSNQKEGFTYF